jgi:hypothetical protein
LIELVHVLVDRGMGTVFEHDELGARDPICERAAGVAGEHIYVDKRTGATMGRDAVAERVVRKG